MEVEIADRQSILPLQSDRLRTAIVQILAEAGYQEGCVSLAVVDDTEMHQLNRQYLQHDYPTDVLSFLLEDDDTQLEAQLIVSAETAQRVATEFAWPAADELLYYVIHGTLHLAGYDDHEPEDLTRMRAAERAHLAHFGLEPPAGADARPIETNPVDPSPETLS